MTDKCISDDKNNLWKEILSRKKSLSDEEADSIENIVKKMRKESFNLIYSLLNLTN